MSRSAVLLPHEAAEFNLSRFFHAAHFGDLDELYETTQLSWLAKRKILEFDPVLVETHLSFLNFIKKSAGYNLYSPIQCSSVFYSFPFALFPESRELVNWFGYANVICEEGSHQPSLDGEWGVNPTSVLSNSIKTATTEELEAAHIMRMFV